jgi:hypothetical protein
MPNLDIEEEPTYAETQRYLKNAPNSRKKYQKKMDIYIDLYEFLKEAKNELYIPIFDVSRFTSQSIKMVVKD